MSLGKGTWIIAASAVAAAVGLGYVGGAVPGAMAGHSLGEFTALVAAGCLDFRVAVDLVKFRAEAMQAAVPQGEGAMAAIIGLEDIDVQAACSEAADSMFASGPTRMYIFGSCISRGRHLKSGKISEPGSGT